MTTRVQKAKRVIDTMTIPERVKFAGETSDLPSQLSLARYRQETGVRIALAQNTNLHPQAQLAILSKERNNLVLTKLMDNSKLTVDAVKEGDKIMASLTEKRIRQILPLLRRDGKTDALKVILRISQAFAREQIIK